MKRWLVCAVALAAVASIGGLPFASTDVGKLRPLEVICVSVAQGEVLIRADTDDSGRGTTVAEAFDDLKRTSSGEVFLDTADFLILTEDARGLLEELSGYLRPACRLCLVRGGVEPEKAAEFLAAHKPGVSIRDYRADGGSLPVLKMKEGRMYLVQP